MTVPTHDEEAIFNVARKLPADDRAVYLDQVCSDDAELRSRMEVLLSAHDDDGFLESPAVTDEVTIERPVTEGPGTIIGRYKLLQKIGEGGFGIVFMAEQQEPVVRKIALKVIKPGMDSSAVVARFEAERQALALMEHPNIAQVFDGGVTDSGRPYFVMELVKGVPITEFCDKNQLTTDQRLRLFIPVCEAVQHAHQKGIIHRDIKPSNIMVTLRDGKPVPKVIDFGISKAINQKLTAKTLFTSYGQMIGTPQYMSPEQAEMSELDVDTRSDIYSLGVLLYELLTGLTPLDSQKLRNAGYAEIQRLICENQPLRPSIRLSSAGEQLTIIADHRSVEPRRLQQLVRGDLDWIVMKSLEKDRSRRYETANALATEVNRYLTGDPIEARPPSAIYLLRKLASRHRVALATTFLIGIALVVATVIASYSASLAWREAKRANEARKELARAAYDAAVSAALANDQRKARKALQLADEAGFSPAEVCVLEGLLALNDGRNDDAFNSATEALESDPENVGAHALYAVACTWAGYDDLGELEFHKLNSLKPQSDADRALMAYTLLYGDSQEARRLLASEPWIERSSFGLMIHGLRTLFDVMGGGDVKWAGKAVKDLGTVRFLFDDNPAALGFHLLALEFAITLSEAEGLTADVERYADEGRKVCQELEAKTASLNFPGGDWGRQRFYLAIGEEEKAWQAIRRVGQHPGSYSWMLAAHCIRHFGPTALEEFDNAMAPEHLESKYVRLARAYILNDSPERAAEVQASVKDMVNDPSPLLRRFALLALCPVYSASEVRDLAAKGPATIRDADGDSLCLDYLASGEGEQQLIERVGPPAYFTIGMMRLAEGDREGARKKLKKCLESSLIGWDHELSRAMLARMEAEDAKQNAED